MRIRAGRVLIKDNKLALVEHHHAGWLTHQGGYNLRE